MNITQTTIFSDDSTLTRRSLNFMGDEQNYQKYISAALADGCRILGNTPVSGKQGMAETELLDTATGQKFHYQYIEGVRNDENIIYLSKKIGR